MYRSASTWQYNLVRIALKKAFNDVGNYFIDEYKGQKHEAIVIKAHKYNANLAKKADYIVTAIRPTEEIRESMERVKAIKQANPSSVFSRAAQPLKIMRFLKWYYAWNVNAVYTQQYADVLNDPLSVVEETLLNIGLLHLVKPEEVLEELNKLKPPKEGVDKETFLIANHITK